MKPILDHIGIAVHDLESVRKLYGDALGLPVHPETEVVESQGVEVAFFEAGEDCNLEFLRPTRQDSPVAKFLAKKGEGIHHICLKVDNLDQVLADLVKKGIPLIDSTPRQGAHGKRIAFIHPKGSNGVLLELCE